jgi:hypothetical protein
VYQVTDSNFNCNDSVHGDAGATVNATMVGCLALPNAVMKKVGETPFLC